MRGNFLIAVVLGLATTVAMGPTASGRGPKPPPACAAHAPDLTFSEPTFIDRHRAGGEPVSVVAQDGSINVSAHAGTTHIYKNPDALPGVRDFLWGYTNQTLNWRSTDGGETWTYTGLAGTGQGPHSLLSTGFSDPDYAMDQDGNLYNVEIDLANDAVYKSTDDGQSWPVATPIAAPGDRPWLTALEPNEVFLYVNLPQQMFRTTDPSLLTWEWLPAPPVTSKSVPDPLNPVDGLIGPVDLGEFALSGDDAQTWETYRFGPEGDAGGRNIFGKSTQFFGVVAADSAGNVYPAAAGGYQGTGDTKADGEVSFAYFNRLTNKWNSTKVNIPIPAGDALFPWTIAGDDGRVAIVWYQNLAGKPNEFYVYAAQTLNGHGTTVTCSDGSTKFYPPQFSVANASGRPIHIGKICLDGTTCNADTNFQGGDRRLGEFLTINYDLSGRLFITSADTRLTSELGTAKTVGNPIFIKQSDGAPLLAEPIPARPTRPLCNLPTC